MDKFVGLLISRLDKIGSHKYFLPICLIAALAVRLAWIYFVAAQPVSDFRWYYERGLDLVAGQGYSVGPDSYWPENLPPAVLVSAGEDPAARRLTAYWPVGYPAFLGLLFWLFGPSLLIAKLANVILSLGILFFSYYLAKSLFASELTGRITLLILSFYPDQIAYSSLLASEILFLFLLLLGVSLLLAPRHKLWLAVAAGASFGLACLIKPQAILVPAMFFAVSLLTTMSRKTVREYLVLLVVVHVALGITLLPWLIRNYRVFNNFVFISNNGGYNLLVGNNPDATGAYVFNQHLVSLLSDTQGEDDRDRKAFTLAKVYIMSHPLATIELWPRKLWYLYGRDTVGIYWNQEGMKSTIGHRGRVSLDALKNVAQFYYMLVGAAFLCSVFLLSRKPKNKAGIRPLSVLGLAMVLYFTVIALLTFGDGRFHFPMMPWIAMYAGALPVLLARSAQQTITTISKPMRRFKWN